MLKATIPNIVTALMTTLFLRQNTHAKMEIILFRIFGILRAWHMIWDIFMRKSRKRRLEEKMYITKQGQAWDQIAKEVYGDEIHADYLMQNNPQHLNIFKFPAGIQLNIPNLPESRKNKPIWR